MENPNIESDTPPPFVCITKNLEILKSHFGDQIGFKCKKFSFNQNSRFHTSIININVQIFKIYKIMDFQPPLQRNLIWVQRSNGYQNRFRDHKNSNIRHIKFLRLAQTFIHSQRNFQVSHFFLFATAPFYDHPEKM